MKDSFADEGFIKMQSFALLSGNNLEYIRIHVKQAASGRSSLFEKLRM